MYHFLGKKATIKRDFPERVDLPYLTDREASAALGLLRLLVDYGAAEVYTAAGGPRADGRYLWNVWLHESVAPPSGRRIPLREWAARSVCVDYTPEGPDAA
jgi:hypothetical protein